MSEFDLSIRIRAAVDQAAAALRGISERLTALKPAGAAGAEGAAATAAGLDSVTASADAAAASVTAAGAALNTATSEAAANAAAVSASLAAGTKRYAPDVLGLGAAYAQLDGIMAGTAKTAEDIAAQEIALDKLMRAGALSAEEQAAALAALTAREEALGIGAAAAAAGVGAEKTVLEGFSFTSGQATREYSALVDELISGRTARIPGTLATLSNRVGLMKLAFSGLGLAVIGAIGTIGLTIGAWAAASREQDEFNRALLISGQYMGITDGQMRIMAADIASGAVTIGNAKDALLSAAQTGRFTGDQLKLVGAGAAAMAQLTDQSVDVATKAFEKLAQDPAKNIQALNEQYHFLTPSVYAEIEALQQQGDAVGAATLAIKTFSDAMTQRLAQNEAHAGAWSSFWDGVFSKLSAGWARTKESFTGASPEEKLRNLNTEVERLNAAISDAGQNQGFTYFEGQIVSVDQLRTRLAELTEQVKQYGATVASMQGAAQQKAQLDQENDAAARAIAYLDAKHASLDKNYALKQELLEVDRQRAALEKVAADTNAKPADRDAARAELQKTANLHAEILERTRDFNNNMVAQDKEELAKLEAADQVAYQDRLKFELDFWKGKLAALKAGSAEYAQVYQTVMQLQHQVDARNATSAQLDVQISQNAATAKLALDRDALNQKLSLGLISRQQELQGEIALENQEYALKLESLKRKQALEKEDALAQKRTQVEIEQLTQQHTQRLEQITNQATLAVRDKWLGIMHPIDQAFSTTIQGMVMGTLTLRQAEANIFQSILAEGLDMGIKLAENWVASHLAMQATTETTTAANIATQTAAAASGHALHATAGVADILTSAAVAAAGAASSVASIPFIGWVMAPLVAAETYAMTAAYAPLASAAGGWWEIPSDQLAQVHKQEMVLPAGPAEGLRRMVERGGGGAPIAVHIHALDGMSVERLLRNHPDALANAIKHAQRRGAFA